MFIVFHYCWLFLFAFWVCLFVLVLRAEVIGKKTFYP